MRNITYRPSEPSQRANGSAPKVVAAARPLSNLPEATSVHRTAVVLPAVAAAYLVAGAWIVFGHGETNLVLAVVTLVLVMFAGLMLAGGAYALDTAPERPRSFAEFLKGKVETATGPLSGLEALSEIATLPLVLVVGGSAILAVAGWAGL